MRKPYKNQSKNTQVLVKPIPTQLLLDARKQADLDATNITELFRTLLVAYSQGQISVTREDGLLVLEVAEPA